MQITKVYSRRFKRDVYRTRIQINGKRFSKCFFSREEAQKAIDARIEQHQSRDWLLLPTDEEFNFGWTDDPRALPEIAATYAIFPEPIWKNMVYAGRSGNIKVRFKNKKHPWYEIIKSHDHPWIVYFPLGNIPQRDHIERVLIEGYRPPYNKV
jgi:hypothetical protein